MSDAKSEASEGSEQSSKSGQSGKSGKPQKPEERKESLKSPLEQTDRENKILAICCVAFPIVVIIIIVVSNTLINIHVANNVTPAPDAGFQTTVAPTKLSITDLSVEIDSSIFGPVPALTSNVLRELTSKREIRTISIGRKTIRVIIVTQLDSINTPRFEILILNPREYVLNNWYEKDDFIYHLANWGYKVFVVAIQGLPTSGNQFQELIEALQMRVNIMVIFSPASTEPWSLPYLFRNSQSEAKVFIPVGAINTDGYGETLRQSTIRTLIIYGENDRSGEDSSKILRRLKNHHIVKIPGAGVHPYDANPVTVLRVLYHMLNAY